MALLAAVAMALHLLLRTAVAAERANAEKLAVGHIPTYASSWHTLHRAARIQSLPQHQQIMLRLLKERGTVSSATLRRLYLTQCQRESIEPVAGRTFSKYITRLAQHDLFTVEAKSTGRAGRLLTATY